MQQHACASCGNVGKNGARFVILVDGEEAGRVHKPCGEKLAAAAPDGTTAEVVHVAELRRRQEEERVRSFWEEKFSTAQARKAARNRAA